MEKPLKTVIMDVTPDDARKMLEYNTHNRKLRQSTVEKYAAAMLAGKWRLHHQGIAYTDESKDRVLVDGQHRLYAVWWLGEQGHKNIKIPFMVVYGVPLDTQLVIDDHAKRNVLDVARLQKGLLEASPMHVSAARSILTYGLGIDAYLITNVRMIEFIRRYWEGLNFAVTEVFQNTKRRGITQAPVVAVCAQAYYSAEDKARLKKFGDYLLDREAQSSQHESAAVLLRSWLMSGHKGVGSSYAGQIYRKTQRALDSFLKREAISKLYESTEQLFPLPGTVKHQRQIKRPVGTAKAS